MSIQALKLNLLLSKIKNLHLDYPSGFEDANAAELIELYNGAGPDWLPQWGRSVLTKALDLFEPAFLIHDYEFHHSDGTKKSFEEANERMYSNMKRLVKESYNPYSFKVFGYLRWNAKAYAAYKSCVEFGWSAWQDGADANE